MQWLKAIFIVLRQGEALSDVKTWKNRHMAANAVLAILAVGTPILSHYGIAFSDEDAAAIAGGVAALGGLITAYFVPATTKKTGLPTRNDDHNQGNHTDADNLMG